MLKSFVCGLMFSALVIGSTCSGQMIVAHRGASFDAPENTLASFQLAWQQNADAIEGDFYLTKDQKIVCLHDKDTARVSPNSQNRKVAASTLAELQALDVGSWKDPKFASERMPTLSDVLANVPEGKKIFVEVKSGPEIMDELEKTLLAADLKPEQIVIIAFNIEVIRQCRQRMPQFKASWLVSYKQDPETGVWAPRLADVLKMLKENGATGLGTNGNADVVDEAFVRAVRDVGCEFHVWTVNDPTAALHWKSLGADSITTDRPEFIRQSLGN
ncbi:glycerophosphodiester phosphodiesterase [Pirellulaceae bacterium SH449]